MNIEISIGRMPDKNEYSERKSITIGSDTFYYWVNKKQDDPNYEEINSEFGSELSAIISLKNDNDNLKQTLAASQMAVFKANQQMNNMKQMMMSMQKAQFNQQNNGGNDNGISK